MKSPYTLRWLRNEAKSIVFTGCYPVDTINILTFANCFNLELGSRDVVTMTFGSSTPAHLYSSSMWFLTPEMKLRFRFNS